MVLNSFKKCEILALHKLGQKIDQIALTLNINRNTVMLWINRYNETGNIERKKRFDCNKCTDYDEDLLIINMSKEHEKFNVQYLKNQLNNLGIIISKTTIWRRLKEINYEYGRYILKPKLTEKQKEKRLIWALEFNNFNWEKVYFSDECTIYLNAENKFCWFIKGHRKVKGKVRHSKKMNVWAFISLIGIHNFKLFTENLNANTYKNILCESFIEIYNDAYTFQQDNHPVHKSKKIKEFIKDKNIKTIWWPPNSPDLNPIENLWHLVKNKLGNKYLTKENFESEIRSVLEEIDLSCIHNIVSNMHVRVQKVIDNNGDHINY